MSSVSAHGTRTPEADFEVVSSDLEPLVLDTWGGAFKQSLPAVELNSLVQKEEGRQTW